MKRFFNMMFVPLFIITFSVLSGIIYYACNTDKTIMEPEPDPIMIEDSEALFQLLRMEHADEIISINTIGENVTELTTVSIVFGYSGEVSIPVSVIRGVSIWHQVDEMRVYVGTSYGSISKSRDREDFVDVLEPGEDYYYWINWDNEPFILDGAKYTNFYSIKGSLSKSNSFLGKSIEQSIKEVL